MRSISKDCFKDSWRDYFYLSDDSPSGLCWKVDRGNGKVFKDSPAGYICSTGHWKVELKGKSIQVHRIIYFLTYGEIPEDMVVDHIDGSPSNNKISNLRLVEFKVNMRNKKMARSCKTDKTGVYERHEFVANWVEDGSIRHKSFPVSKYGSRAFQEACSYRDAQIERLNSMGYGYTEGHGK